MCQHRVEHRQQLAHTGGEGHLRCFPNRPQSRIEHLEDGIVAHSRQRAHVQHSPDRCPSAPDRPCATPGAAIEVKGGDPNQHGDLLAGQDPHLWHLLRPASASAWGLRPAYSENISSVACHRGLAWIAAATSSSVRAKRRVNQVMWAGMSRPDRLGSRLQTATCGREHLPQLAPSRQQTRSTLVREPRAGAAASAAPPPQRAPAPVHRGYPVAAEAAGGFGNIPRVAGIHPQHGQTGLGQDPGPTRTSNPPVASRTTRVGWNCPQALDQAGDPRLSLVDVPAGIRGTQSHVQLGLRDINPDKHLWSAHGLGLPLHPAWCDADSDGPAKFGALARQRRHDPVLTHGLSRPEGRRPVTSRVTG